jgi:transcriptional regulator with XRE-family HTH domain
MTENQLNEPRCLRLRRMIGESQDVFAVRIGQSQGTVWRLEKGRPEKPAQTLLLDLIERDIAEGRIAVLPSAGSVSATAECQSDAA